MVKLLEERLEYAFDLAEITYPSRMRIYLPLDVKRYAK